jgi:Uma2 family endonuclease
MAKFVIRTGESLQSWGLTDDLMHKTCPDTLKFYEILPGDSICDQPHCRLITMVDSKSAFALIEYPETDGQPMSESDATRDYLLYSVAVLESYFQGHRNVYVSGNLFIYYEEGNNKKSISPDVFVIFGVSKRKRRSYKTWQEGGKLPSFVLEVTSFSTKRQDEVEKVALYASLGVEEYFQYDPTGDYLNPQLKGRRLVDGVYQPLPLQRLVNGDVVIHSQVLGLDLCLQPPSASSLLTPQIAPLALELRYYDAQTGTKLLSYRESEQAREQAEAERILAEQAREQAEAERILAEQAREQAEQARRTAVSRLKALGLTVAQIAAALDLTVDEVETL